MAKKRSVYADILSGEDSLDPTSLRPDAAGWGPFARLLGLGAAEASTPQVDSFVPYAKVGGSIFDRAQQSANRAYSTGRVAGPPRPAPRKVAPKLPIAEPSAGPANTQEEAIAQAAVNAAEETLPTVKPAAEPQLRTPASAGGDDDLMRLLTEAYRYPSNVGMKPLSALVDAWTGSKFANMYMQEPTVEAQTRGYVGARMELEKLNAVKMASLLKAMKGAGKGGLTEKDISSYLMRGGSQFTKRAEKITDEFSKRGEAYTKLLSAIERGTVSDINSAISLIARTYGEEVGNLAQQEQARAVMPTFVGDWGQLIGYITGDPTQKMPPELLAQLRMVAKSGAEGTIDSAKTKLSVLVDAYKRMPELVGIGFDPSERAKPYIGAIEEKGAKLGALTKGGSTPEGGQNKRAMIRVVSPDGKKGTIPESNLEKALKAGYKRVP